MEVQIIEGTIGEVTSRLHQVYTDDVRVRVFVESDEQDLSTNIPAPPNSVRDREHLFQLLREGLSSLDNGDGIEVTANTWEQAHRELDRRLNSSVQ